MKNYNTKASRKRIYTKTFSKLESTQKTPEKRDSFTMVIITKLLF
jgi:hypothetical protein